VGEVIEDYWTPAVAFTKGVKVEVAFGGRNGEEVAIPLSVYNAQVLRDMLADVLSGEEEETE
jgi:hypothetical protein